MTDTLIKGSGNSRSLKTVPNALTLYPTYQDMMAAMAAGSFPIDLGPLNPIGLDTKGTDLNKASLLKDTTAALFGLGVNAVPDDALKQIANLGGIIETGTFSDSLSYPLTLVASGTIRLALIWFGGKWPSGTSAKEAVYLGFSRFDLAVIQKNASDGYSATCNVYLNDYKGWGSGAAFVRLSGNSCLVSASNVGGQGGEYLFVVSK